MKWSWLLVFLFITGFLSAQETNLWNNIRHSSYTIDNELHIRGEVVDIPGYQTDFFFSQGGGWYNQELHHLTGLTYEAIIPVNSQDMVQCRYRTLLPGSFEGLEEIIPGLPDSLVVMMSGFKTNNSFPAPMSEMALVREDETGDINEGFGAYLDITAQYFARSASKFYTVIANNSNSFPTGPVTGPYNLYASLIINPETVVEDSVFYALIYGQIPVLLTPGLYRFSGLNMDSIARLGNIEYQSATNNLQMACSIDLLTSDPYFGNWPNMTNSLIFITITLQVSLTMEFSIVDIGQVALMVMDDYLIEPFENNLPEISGIEVIEIFPTTTINLTYYDQNGNFPLISEIVLDNESVHQMEPLSLNFNEPVVFTASFVSLWSNGFVRFSDDGYLIVEQPIYTAVNEPELPQIFLSSLISYPNPFIPQNHNDRLTVQLKNSSNIELFELGVYDIRGRKVYQWRDSDLTGKQPDFYWDGRDLSGEPVSSGVYFIHYSGIPTGEHLTNKIIIIR